MWWKIICQISVRKLFNIKNSTINYSSRASELGCIINLLDQRRSNLSLSEHRRLSEANLIARSTIDMPWRNFLSPEFRKKFQRDVPLFLQIPNFLETQCRTGRKKPPRKKTQLDPSNHFNRTLTCDRLTQTQGP